MKHRVPAGIRVRDSCRLALAARLEHLQGQGDSDAMGATCNGPAARQGRSSPRVMVQRTTILFIYIAAAPAASQAAAGGDAASAIGRRAGRIRVLDL